MKRKVFIAFMIVFTVFLGVNLFISLICGAPWDSSELERYIVGAAGMSILLPASFTLLVIRTLDMGRKSEKAENSAEDKEEGERAFDAADIDAQIPAFVSSLAEKRNLTPEQTEKLLAFLEDIK